MRSRPPGFARCLALCLALSTAAACSGDNDTGDGDDSGGTDNAGTDDGDGDGDPGSLVDLTMSSQVGVLLDEFPAADRDRIAEDLLARGDDFWIERARWQLRLTSIRLVYRKYYFDEEEQDRKNALPLPPESVWTITLDGAPERTTVDGHDLVAVGYQFQSTLLSDADSPAISEPALADVGGAWDEEFVFPVDPTLLLQRTGFACLTEDQFPPDSVDASEAYRFYDDTCEAEGPGMTICHYSEPRPTESCVEALQNHVGSVETAIHYERAPWDDARADEVRTDTPRFPDSPDLKVLTTGEGLNDHRVIYKYIPDDSCAVAERCVAAPGWRRLLLFDSHDHNVGGKPIDIGDVDYFVEGLGGELIDHNVYELSECHNHYHFSHYGDFSFDADGVAELAKNGFCLEDTDRLSNNEYAPLRDDYYCEHQGVAAGWGDLYNSSLPCNWLDITDVDTAAGPITGDLTFRSNPDDFLCEGELLKDDQGSQIWEPTEFTTEAGDPVDRPACTQTPGAQDNDVGSVSVTIPERGGFVTQACEGDTNLGPVRNCGFELQPETPTCTPGETVTLSCTGADETRAQVVRVCESSALLATGMDCEHRDSLANIVMEGGSADVTFTCPDPRDASEPGGAYAIYTAPVWGPDGATAVTCN
jgi:hypothetical protein